MSDQPDSYRLNRVTLALSGSGDPGEIIEFAGALARAARASLHGLLLEDVSLYDLAELPFSVSVTPGHQKPNIPLTAETLEREYEREERACRKLISAHARRSEISWSFERKRGALPDLLTSASRDELLLVQTDDASAGPPQAIQHIAAGKPPAGGLAFLHRGRINRPGPVVAFCSSARECAHVLSFARQFASVTEKPLEILLTSPSSVTNAGDIALSIDAVSGARVRSLASATAEQLITETAGLQPSLIIGNFSTWPFSDSHATGELIKSVRCPCVMLRGQQPGKAEGSPPV